MLSSRNSTPSIEDAIMQTRREGSQPFGVLVGRFSEVLKPKADIFKRALKYAVAQPLDYIINWGRLYSLWPTHLETACCSVEVGAVSGSRWDIERFGILEAFGSLRQCDLLIVMGTVNRKLAPRLRVVWDQMPEPKFCMAMGACAISGGLYEQSYNVLQGVDGILPVDIFIPGCPPSAQSLIDAAVKLQEKIRHMDRRGNVVSYGYHRLSPKNRLK